MKTVSLKKQKEVSRQISPKSEKDTISAIATPPGAGGVAIIRISGNLSYQISLSLTGKSSLKPRYAHYVTVKDLCGGCIDQGIAIFFPGPNSFTGEDVVELQMHGSPVLLNKIIHVINSLGAREAEPGEFSKRAFLNDKIDLAQAEAILDVIHAQSEKAAIAAQNSLQGIFSRKINDLLDELKHTRIYLEASLDFSEEDIEHETREYVLKKIKGLALALDRLLDESKDGCVISQGVKTAIIGPPNAGKSSLFNVLTKDETAIVSSEAGTTRDLLKETVTVGQIPLHLIDTAGLRETCSDIENIGIERAKKELGLAELVILVFPATVDAEHEVNRFIKDAGLSLDGKKVLVVFNKVDLLSEEMREKLTIVCDYPVILTSALSGEGLEDFSEAIKSITLNDADSGDSAFSARARHIGALELTLEHINRAKDICHVEELCAEELKLASLSLSEVTGKYSSDDLLGDIFANFCIGK